MEMVIGRNGKGYKREMDNDMRASGVTIGFLQKMGQERILEGSRRLQEDDDFFYNLLTEFSLFLFPG